VPIVKHEVEDDDEPEEKVLVFNYYIAICTHSYLNNNFKNDKLLLIDKLLLTGVIHFNNLLFKKSSTVNFYNFVYQFYLTS